MLVVGEGVIVSVDVVVSVGNGLVVSVGVTSLAGEWMAVGIAVGENASAADVSVAIGSGVGGGLGVGDMRPTAHPDTTAISMQAASAHVLGHAIGFV